MNERKRLPTVSHDRGQSTGMRRMLAAATTVAYAGALTVLGPLAPSTSQAATSSARSITTPLTALAAKTFSLDENGSLHLTSKQGFTLNEEGPAAGTVGGTIYVHLKIVSSTRVTAEISIYPRGGSITCVGSASYKREGSSANFSGSLSIERGTGSYAHARGSGLNFSGTIQRSNDAIAVRVGGTAAD
jgi:hypothetical protein